MVPWNAVRDSDGGKTGLLIGTRSWSGWFPKRRPLVRIFLSLKAVACIAMPVVMSVSSALAQSLGNQEATPTPALKTPWAEPDLQGIWTDQNDTPLQRLAKYSDQEFFTEAQRAELDRQRASLLARDNRGVRGTEADVTGGYNSVFLSLKHLGARTSLIIGPANGRLPPPTPDAQKIAAAERE